MTTTYLITAMLAAWVIGFSKGGLANFGSLAVPLMSLTMPTMQAAALTLPLLLMSDVVAVYIYRRSFSRRNLAILIPGGVAGCAAGWATATMVSDSWMRLFIGVIGFVFCLYMFFRPANTPARAADVPRGVFWGFLAGLTSFISHAGAPPYQVYTLPQKLTPIVFAGTTTLFFATVNVSKVVPYMLLGELHTESFTFALMLLPVVLAGVLCGWKALRLLPARVFFQIVQWALFVISCKLIYDGVTGVWVSA